MPTKTEASRSLQTVDAGSAARQLIGYWVKRLDHLIEASFEKTLAAQRLTRRHWQALNVIRPGSVGRPRLDEALAPFLTGSRNELAHIVDDLRQRGWVAETGGLLSLTMAGEAAVAGLSDAVGSLRTRTTTDITEVQFATTVDTLARMCANLQ
jgi:hypothetical protein